jgi:electron transfer flavoprotein beta subunit
MNIICLVKFVPDVDNFVYDYDRNVLVRENVKMILNPDDAAALAFALKIKDKYPETFIEVVSMAPKSIIGQLEDLLRRNVDKATLISDKAFVGSDTYITSKILAKYLKTKTFDCILTGTHALDGDTSHVPAQLGELLSLAQLSNVIKIDENNFLKNAAIVDVDWERVISTYRVNLPAILSVQKESKYKLPHIKFKNLHLDVSANIDIVSNAELDFDVKEVGIDGSLTKVSRTYPKKMEKKERVIVENNEEGIEVVYQFLKSKGYI